MPFETEMASFECAINLVIMLEIPKDTVHDETYMPPSTILIGRSLSFLVSERLMYGRCTIRFDALVPVAWPVWDP